MPHAFLTTSPIHPTGPVGLRRTPRMVDESGVRLGLVHAALVLVTLLCDAVHVSPAAAMVLLTLAVLGCGRTLPVLGALLSGLSAWALWNGFVENRAGQLTLAPHDLSLVVMVVAAALAGSLAARWSR